MVVQGESHLGRKPKTALNIITCHAEYTADNSPCRVVVPLWNGQIKQDDFSGTRLRWQQIKRLCHHRAAVITGNISSWPDWNVFSKNLLYFIIKYDIIEWQIIVVYKWKKDPISVNLLLITAVLTIFNWIGNAMANNCLSHPSYIYHRSVLIKGVENM